MNRVMFALVMFLQIVNLCVTVVARCNTVIGVRLPDLLEFSFAVIPSGFRESRLQEAAPAAAAVVVGSVGRHVDEILLAHNCLDHIPQVFGHWIAEALANQLAGVLNRELDLEVLVPVRINFQFSFPDPLGIILNDALTLEIMLDVESLQSDPDRKKFVPSLRIEPDLTFEIIHGFGLDPNNFLPILQIRAEKAVVFSCPTF